MIKKLILMALLLSLFSEQGLSQDQADLNINNVRARFTSTGSLFWDLNSMARFEVPKVTDPNGIRKNTIFMATLWFHAIDSNGDTLISVDLYHQDGTDFGQGVLPPGADTGFTPILDNKIFNLKRDDVEAARYDTLRMSDDIKTWPTFYVYQGDTIPLAPYTDGDKNGVYDPYTKDQAFILGDQSLLFYYHDMVDHTLSKSKPIGLQIQVEGYGYSTNDKINNYVFVRYKIISQNQDLKQFRVGVLSDYDLGNYSDDFVGTDTSRNMTYVWNGDDDDEGILGYGLNPPAFATVFLNKPLCASCMSLNSRTGDFRNPETYSEFRNMLYGLEVNGDSMLVNANGFPTNTFSNYHFTGDPTKPGQDWSMDTDNRFQPGDYRMLGITGQEELIKGDTFDLWLLFAYARTTKTGFGSRGSVLTLQEDIDDIFTRYFNKPQIPANCFAPSTTKDTTGQNTWLFEKLKQQANSTIYPNPADQSLTVKLSDIEADFTCEIMNELGQAILANQGSGELKIDCSNLPQGIYYVHLEATQTGQRSVHKLVVLH